jgi:hypothetical protein
MVRQYELPTKKKQIYGFTAKLLDLQAFAFFYKTFFTDEIG